MTGIGVVLAGSEMPAGFGRVPSGAVDIVCSPPDLQETARGRLWAVICMHRAGPAFLPFAVRHPISADAARGPIAERAADLATRVAAGIGRSEVHVTWRLPKPDAPKAEGGRDWLRHRAARAAAQTRNCEALSKSLADLIDLGSASPRVSPLASDAVQAVATITDDALATVQARLERHLTKLGTGDITVSGPWPLFFPCDPCRTGGLMSQERDFDGLQAMQALQQFAASDGRVRLNPDSVEQDMARLVLGLLAFLRELMERQAIRRMEAGSLTADQEEALGATLMKAEAVILQQAAAFGLAPEDLSLDLGPLGRTI